MGQGCQYATNGALRGGQEIAGMSMEAIRVRNVFALGGVITILVGLWPAWVFRTCSRNKRVAVEGTPEPAALSAGAAR